MPLLNFDAGQFVKNLPYLGKGMLGIFVVIGLIIAVTALLNTITNKLNKK